jgi:hypothetical protein
MHGARGLAWHAVPAESALSSLGSGQADRRFAVSGAGYAPHGGFSLDGLDALAADIPLLADIARASLLCNDAVVREVEG